MKNHFRRFGRFLAYNGELLEKKRETKMGALATPMRRVAH